MITDASVEAARKGDRQAIRAIIDALRDPLFRYVYRILGNATDAEDVFQETCVRMITNLEKIPVGGNFRAWMYRIATNLCLDRKRTKTRPHPPAPPAPISAGAEAESRELIRAAERAMAALPEKQKAALVLRVIDGFPYAAIAEILETTEANARWYLFEARRRLKQMLNGSV